MLRVAVDRDQGFALRSAALHGLGQADARGRASRLARSTRLSNLTLFPDWLAWALRRDA